jgi:hypothetical protein
MKYAEKWAAKRKDLPSTMPPFEIINATDTTRTNANGVKVNKTLHFEFHNLKLISNTSSIKPAYYS